MMEEAVKLSLIVLGSLGILAGIVKWGIEKYFQKHKEVEQLKEKINQEALKSIQTSMNHVANEIVRLGDGMAELEGNLIVFNTKLFEFDKHNKDVLRNAINLHSQVKDRLKIFDGLEIHENDDKLIVFKRKRH